MIFYWECLRKDTLLYIRRTCCQSDRVIQIFMLVNEHLVELHHPTLINNAADGRKRERGIRVSRATLQNPSDKPDNERQEYKASLDVEGGPSGAYRMSSNNKDLLEEPRIVENTYEA